MQAHICRHSFIGIKYTLRGCVPFAWAVPFAVAVAVRLRQWCSQWPGGPIRVTGSCAVVCPNAWPRAMGPSPLVPSSISCSALASPMSKPLLITCSATANLTRTSREPHRARNQRCASSRRHPRPGYIAAAAMHGAYAKTTIGRGKLPQWVGVRASAESCPSCGSCVIRQTDSSAAAYACCDWAPRLTGGGIRLAATALRHAYDGVPGIWSRCERPTARRWQTGLASFLWQGR